jgi:hypothetical protein
MQTRKEEEVQRSGGDSCVCRPTECAGWKHDPSFTLVNGLRRARAHGLYYPHIRPPAPTCSPPRPPAAAWRSELDYITSRRFQFAFPFRAASVGICWRDRHRAGAPVPS